MVEQFHQFYQSEFCVVTVHIIDLPAKCLSKRMATKVLDLQPVLLLHLFKNDVNSLNGEDSAFLTYKDWRIDSNRIYMLVALFDMLL